MADEIIVALITGGLSFLGVVITNSRGRMNLQKEIEKQQAVFDTKLDELTREVRKHNEFAERIPVIENKIKVNEHRIEDIERKIEE